MLRSVTFVVTSREVSQTSEALDIRRSLISLLLLVLFVRLMVPEAAVLALHQHEHTEHEYLDDAKVSTKHQHCHVDDLFNTDFTVPSFSVELRINPAGACYMQPYSFAWKFTYPHNTYLRGPPTA